MCVEGNDVQDSAGGSSPKIETGEVVLNPFEGYRPQDKTLLDLEQQGPAKPPLPFNTTSQHEAMAIRRQNSPQQNPNPFVFINEQELQRSRSNELRRAVRSHVRRDTHMRQRRLNAAAKPNSASIKRILKKPDSRYFPAIESNAVNESSRGLPSRNEGVSLSTISGQSAGQSAFPSHVPVVKTEMGKKNAEWDPNNTPSRPVACERGLVNHTMPIPVTEGFSRVQRQQFDENTPYSLLLENEAPLLYLRGKNWPFPQPLRGPRPAVSIWMPSATIPIPNSHAVRPCLLKSARTVPWIINSFEYFLFKDEVIKWVNAQLQEPRNGISETTMGVIICLTTWELCRPTKLSHNSSSFFQISNHSCPKRHIPRENISEVTQHLDGLQRIIELRGNIPDARHFGWKLQLVDLLVAIMTSGKPRLEFQLPRPIPPPHYNRSIGTLQIPDSPLYGTQPLSLVLANSAFSNQSIKILQDMRDLTDIHQLGSHHLVQNMPSPCRNLPTDSSSASLFRMINLTSYIYNRSLSTPPILFSSPINHQAMEQICRDLEETANDETWVRYPGVLLWIILTSASAAAFRAERGFFLMLLMRVGTSAAWWGPEQARISLLRFLRVKRRSEGLEESQWAPV